MPSQHVIDCPNCKERLLVEFSDSVGGTVQDNLTVLDHGPAVEAAPVEETAPAVEAPVEEVASA